jgi:hypothetical protein
MLRVEENISTSIPVLLHHAIKIRALAKLISISPSSFIDMVALQC